MPTLFGMLELNKRSLFASQYSLQTSNHNISNINNPGYSRQEVLFRTNMPTRSPQGILGNGVSVSTVRRATADFYTSQMRDETASFGGWDIRSSTLSHMEMIFNEPSDTGMSSAIDKFFEAWNDLSIEPQSSSSRVAVVESASTLCKTFHSMNGSLEELRENLNDQIEEKVSGVNDLLDAIADLNKKIVESETSNVTAADFRDERDRLIQDLSRIIAVSVKEDEYGAVDLHIEGVNVVHRSEASHLEVYLNTEGNISDLQVGLKGQKSPLLMAGGELKGLIDSRDGYLLDAQSSLDRLACVFVDKVNEIHNMGWAPSGSGFDFFEGIDAGSINVSYAITGNPDLVAASYSGEIGDNSLANDIFNLSTTQISAEEPLTISELYESIVAAVGIHGMNANNMVENQDLILSNLEMRKESITGVNLDEELMNVSKFQQSYEAAAKVMGVVEELIQTILDMT